MTYGFNTDLRRYFMKHGIRPRVYPFAWMNWLRDRRLESKNKVVVRDVECIRDMIR